MRRLVEMWAAPDKADGIEADASELVMVGCELLDRLSSMCWW